MNENVGFVDDESTDGSADGDAKRQRSKIQFPYSDYADAEGIARTVHSYVGHGLCSLDQLAPWANQSVKSSTFRSQVGAARMFGLIESEDSESYKLTELGIRAMDQGQARASKAEAFMRVPLFKAVFEKYKGGVLPPNPPAIERELISLGVAEKQSARARQVLISSAEQTGFFEQGKNKLVMPAVVVPPPSSEASTKKNGNGGGGGSGGDGDGLSLDPLLMALLRKIPPAPEKWPADKRLRWFKTFAMNVSQVYDDGGDPVELEIKLPPIVNDGLGDP